MPKVRKILEILLEILATLAIPGTIVGIDLMFGALTGHNIGLFEVARYLISAVCTECDQEKVTNGVHIWMVVSVNICWLMTAASFFWFNKY